MERYDLIVPNDFKYGKEMGILLAAQISDGFKNGIRHFDASTKKELTTVESVLESINSNDCFVSWHKDMGENMLGMTTIKNGDAKAFLLPMHPEIGEIVFGDYIGRDRKDNQ